jgi:hypothetical protein
MRLTDGGNIMSFAPGHGLEGVHLEHECDGRLRVRRNPEVKVVGVVRRDVALEAVAVGADYLERLHLLRPVDDELLERVARRIPLLRVAGTCVPDLHVHARVVVAQISRRLFLRRLLLLRPPAQPAHEPAVRGLVAAVVHLHDCLDVEHGHGVALLQRVPASGGGGE